MCHLSLVSNFKGRATIATCKRKRALGTYYTVVSTNKPRIMDPPLLKANSHEYYCLTGGLLLEQEKKKMVYILSFDRFISNVLVLGI